MISIVSWLSTKEWNKKSWDLDELKRGDVVTVDGEYSNEPVSKKSFYAVVVGRDVANREYILERCGHATTIRRQRQYLRHRVIKTVCVSSVSDDKKHDRHQYAHFSTQEFEWLRTYLVEHFPEDLPASKDGQKIIRHLFQHSDNAAQHFKSTGSMHFFAQTWSEHAAKCDAAFKDRPRSTYVFGCPGHGKGAWDGVGGTQKAAIVTAVKHSQMSGKKILGRSHTHLRAPPPPTPTCPPPPGR